MAEPLEKFAAESKLFDMNCTEQLAEGEIIASVPVVSFLPSMSGADALVLGAPVVNTVDVEYPDGGVAPAGKALQLRIGGGSVAAGEVFREYVVLATIQTTHGNTLIARGALRVVPLMEGLQ